jgi:hypothetical protein
MLAKLLMAGFTLVLTYLAMRRWLDARNAARKRVRADNDRHERRRLPTLRQDPHTGVYRPVDRE